MLKVYVQTSTDYVADYLAGLRYDITERIPISEINKLVEKIEQGRNAFRTSSLSIKNINNSDSFFTIPTETEAIADGFWVDLGGGMSALSYHGAGLVYYGMTTVILYNDVEIYRGNSQFQDFDFDGVNRTISVSTFTWHKELKKYKIDDVPEFEFNLRAFFGQILNKLRSSGAKFDSFDYNLSGILDIPFNTELKQLPFSSDITYYNLTPGVIIGETDWADIVDDDSDNDDDTDIDFTNYTPFGSRAWNGYVDAWQDPRNSKIYGLRVDLNESNIDIYVYLLYGNGHQKVYQILELLGGNATIDSIFYAKFIPNVIGSNGHIGLFLGYEWIDNSGRSNSAYRVITLKPNSEDSYLTSYLDRTSDYNNVVIKNDGLVFDFSLERDIYTIKADGKYYYKLKSIDPGIVSAKRYNSSGAYIDTRNIVETANTEDVYFPFINTITVRGRLYWYTGSWTDLALTLGNIIPVDFPVRKEFIVPTGYKDRYYNGKSCFFPPYFYEGANTLLSNFVDYGSYPYNYEKGSFWVINDVFYLVVAGLNYQSELTYEDLFCDIAQLFNSIYVINKGIIYFLDRDDYSDEYTISEDYIQRKNYDRTLIDNSESPVLNVKANYYDKSDDPYGKYFLLGLIRNYYLTLIGRFVQIKMIIPLEIGKNLKLSDQITINETSESGVLIEKNTNFQSGNRMCELVIERTL